MIKSVNSYPISQLFDIDSNVVYHVPKYQREYTWTKREWENLFDDILENDPGYYLGSIICINQSGDALSVQELELVDGQQRLTTISLLFAATYQMLKEHEAELDEEQKVELFNLKRKLVLKSDNNVIRLRPQVQNNNEQDFRAVLSDVGITHFDTTPPYAGNRKIFRAFRYFFRRLEFEGNASGNIIQFVMEFLSRVNKAVLVKIEVANHADAYVLFESLNNRGVPLSVIDLIKNKLLAKLELTDPGNTDRHFKQWNTLLEYLGDNYSIQERFFRHYYNAFRKELKDVYQVPVATRSNLIHIYEKLLDADPVSFLENITEAGHLYSILLSRTQEERLSELERPLLDLERIQGTPAYLLLLYFMVKRDQLQLDVDHLLEIIQSLVRFFVRRNLTDTPPTRDLTRLFMTIIEIIDGLEELTGDNIVDCVRKELMKVSASDQVFREKLEGPIYDENAGVTRFILCTLAEQGMTRETKVDLWEVKKNQFVWTIEHIFPQGERIPPAWVDMIANGDEMKAKDHQQIHVHKLGNLTISGFNSALGNKSFEEKRDRKDKQGRHVGYNNGLKLNEDLVNCSEWTIQQIDIRTKKLVDQAMDLFKLM